MFVNNTNVFIKQARSYTRMYMNYLQRLERTIKNNFPGISESELKERISLAKHIIALNHEKKKQLLPLMSSQ